VIAVILVGGEGTRLRPITLEQPKAMVPIAGRPFLAHMLDRLAAAGVERVIFSCGYLPDPIRDTFGDAYAGMTLEYAVEPEPRDTAGAIRFAAYGRVTAGPFLALNGDVLAAADVADLMAFHRAAGAKATLTLTAVEDPSRYGLVLADDDGLVTAFLEKPAPEAAPAGPGPFWINAGAYALDASVLDLIAPDGRVSIERDVFPQLVGAGLYGWRSSGYWNDIGTPFSYVAANVAVVSGALGHEPLAAIVGVDAFVNELARVDGATVVGARARIGARAVVTGSVLHDDAVVEDGALVIDSVVGRGARVGAAARVAGGTIVGAGVAVRPGTTLDGELLFPAVPVDA
jgi:mannose-1-phosphate guanylyltransferase